jgi:hypothetical protein
MGHSLGPKSIALRDKIDGHQDREVLQAASAAVSRFSFDKQIPREI